MAGRPAPSRASGSNGLLYGLIAFVVTTVLFLGLFIFMLTKVKSAEDAVVQAERRLKSFGSPPQFYVSESAARGNMPVAQLMAQEIGSLGELVAGKAEVGPAIRDYAATVLTQVSAAHSAQVRPNDTLTGALTRLSEALTGAQRELAGMNAKFTTAQTELERLAAEQTALREQFESTSKDFAEKLAAAEARRDETLSEKDKQVEGLTASLDQSTQDLSSLKRDSQSYARDAEFAQARLSRQLGDLQTQIRQLKPSQFDPDAILRNADGKVLRAIPGSDVVYVGLGERDGVSVGLGLEVYSKTGEQRDGVRGKASLEIVTISEKVSECRVTRRTAGAPILEGDLCVNIAFAKDRKPKFVVRGDFDLNYDGNVDAAGREGIEALVRQWGGQVADELNESVDYLVIGLAPQIPVAPSGELTDIVRDQQFQKELEASKFAEVVQKASLYGIPTITQNQFLFLTGYSGDAPVRVSR
ncbi:MAG: hypothetical protein SF069_11335 [Phycisphaerae bacterium]|nr:hypothetical protein [Phycisphaerae bacterium]